MTNAELIKAVREVANWIVAMSYNSEYAHDELKMLHYEDSIRAAADALEAADAKIVKLNTKCADLQSQINTMENEIEELEEDIVYWQTYAAEIER